MFPGHLRESRDQRPKVKYRLAWALLFLAITPLAADPVILGDPPPSEKGLSWRDIQTGTGAEVIAGKLVAVHYTGKLTSGKLFDTSHATGAPFLFVEGVTHLLPGWTDGLAGMRAGGKRVVTVPPSLAYGEEGVPGFIPTKATLIYEVEVLRVE